MVVPQCPHRRASAAASSLPFGLISPHAMSVNNPTRPRPLTLGEIVVLLLVVWALWAMGAHAQVVPIRTAPVATGSQFQFHPSRARGMGGVHLAVDDTLGDAFATRRRPPGWTRRGRTRRSASSSRTAAPLCRGSNEWLLQGRNRNRPPCLV